MPGQGVAGAHSVMGGENVTTIVTQLVDLCINSISPNVPPQDTQTALEGLLALGIVVMF